ncbi:hypothetical protein LEP1GSC083_0634 [Leptospira interrogans serovar Pyrogenes str. L0374]|uniref:Uncharacterized protein n=3 Tax=Leptospira interrogans TaxID=173 RepID=M7A3Q7_LEPIR|nr:hypothetical protein G436_3495 [Leptospira interrogans serovar Hardjo str. Norma]EJP03859.1 hypothetical protein LEP1GSC007_0406 [Leptospira interrogans serovar Bulgarica str. Mallika]EKO06858.1 hypothetical protein LEP1GSC077_4411 [Leptospira interrogans str. C10069]EKO96534.1 hypothetical protein LEP1GSC057_4188 [Leptospira interrogans str. Brem 329]EKR25716.1 hypothetical protein LEP1GSC087_0268 [Leptospira interrogans serovar Bataviae str. L1111]EMN31927.1 hypothetical protein LEP1GSC08
MNETGHLGFAGSCSNLLLEYNTLLGNSENYFLGVTIQKVL